MTLREFMTTPELLTERQTTHGNFTDNSLVAQAIKNILRCQHKWESLSPFQAEALDMIAHKMGRIIAGDSRLKDHWDDIAGYAKLTSDRL